VLFFTVKRERDRESFTRKHSVQISLPWGPSAADTLDLRRGYEASLSPDQGSRARRAIVSPSAIEWLIVDF